jgi:hypothetical protein
MVTVIDLPWLIGGPAVNLRRRCAIASPVARIARW